MESGDPMKTISEIQNEIRDMGIKLNELLNELEELKPKDNINKQIDFSKINRLAKQYPIENHKLEMADNYKKKLYLCMLSAIAQTNNDNREEKLVFLQRILLGIKYEGSFETIVKDGVNISDKILDEFVECMTDNDSKQLFIFESLVISNLGGEMDDIAKKYISEISGYLGVAKDEIMFLIKLSVCVLEQSNDEYKQLVNMIPKTINISLFFDSYLRKFINGIICNTKSMYYAYDIDADAEMVNLVSDKDLEGRKLIFENVKFDLKAISSDLKLRKNSSVYFINCNFTSEDKYISFETIEDVVFFNCKFEKFSKSVLIFNNSCKNVKIEKCIFERCGRSWRDIRDINDYNREGGGCLWVNQINNFILKNSEFINCYIGFGDGSGAIAYINRVNNFEVNNVSCKNCKGKSSFTPVLFCIEYDVISDYKKQCQEHFINCKTVNSSELY